MQPWFDHCSSREKNSKVLRIDFWRKKTHKNSTTRAQKFKWDDDLPGFLDVVNDLDSGSSPNHASLENEI